MDSNAKNKPAMGAPKPAEMPAAEPAAMSPKRREDAAGERSLVPFPVLVPVVPVPIPVPVPVPVPSPRRLMPPAMDAPISTEGPSGPRDAPEPSVTTAAAAFSVGFAAERRTSEASGGVSEASSFARSSSFAQGHLGFSSPSNPSARNRRPVTAKPAAVGAATVPTAWSQVSGRTSRTPSSWYRSGRRRW